MAVNGSLGRSNFSKYSPLDFASSDRSWIFSHGCREEYCPRNFCPGCYILDNGDSCSRLPSNDDQAVRLLFPGILVLVLLLMVIDYFNGCVHACGIGIPVKLKLWKNLRWYFYVYGLVFIFGCLQKMYKIVS
jgi:hypothetical protein